MKASFKYYDSPFHVTHDKETAENMVRFNDWLNNVEFPLHLARIIKSDNAMEQLEKILWDCWQEARKENGKT